VLSEGMPIKTLALAFAAAAAVAAANLPRAGADVTTSRTRSVLCRSFAAQPGLRSGACDSNRP